MLSANAFESKLEVTSGDKMQHLSLPREDYLPTDVNKIVLGYLLSEDLFKIEFIFPDTHYFYRLAKEARENNCDSDCISIITGLDIFGINNLSHFMEDVQDNLEKYSTQSPVYIPLFTHAIAEKNDNDTKTLFEYALKNEIVSILEIMLMHSVSWENKDLIINYIEKIFMVLPEEYLIRWVEKMPSDLLAMKREIGYVTKYYAHCFFHDYLYGSLNVSLVVLAALAKKHELLHVLSSQYKIGVEDFISFIQKNAVYDFNKYYRGNWGWYYDDYESVFVKEVNLVVKMEVITDMYYELLLCLDEKNNADFKMTQKDRLAMTNFLRTKVNTFTTIQEINAFWDRCKDRYCITQKDSTDYFINESESSKSKMLDVIETKLQSLISESDANGQHEMKDSAHTVKQAISDIASGSSGEDKAQVVAIATDLSEAISQKNGERCQQIANELKHSTSLKLQVLGGLLMVLGAALITISVLMAVGTLGGAAPVSVTTGVAGSAALLAGVGLFRRGWNRSEAFEVVRQQGRRL